MIPDISLYLLYGALTVLMLAFTMLELNPIGSDVYVVMYNDKEEAKAPATKPVAAAAE